MDISVIVNDPGWNVLADYGEAIESACHAACQAANVADRNFEVSIVLGSNAQIADLNRVWRGKTGPTNVLSFPATLPRSNPADAIPPLGDIILAFGVVADEARQQSKTLHAHFSHLVVHGLLHLLGYDHQDDRAAELMEAIEATALQSIGVADPYKELVTTSHSA